jgi:hypothetical protein
LLLSKEESLQNETLNNAAREICNTTLNMWNTLKKLQQSAQNKVYKN